MLKSAISDSSWFYWFRWQIIIECLMLGMSQVSTQVCFNYLVEPKLSGAQRAKLCVEKMIKVKKIGITDNPVYMLVKSIPVASSRITWTCAVLVGGDSPTRGKLAALDVWQLPSVF